jgi:hypothetical protein
MPQLHEGCARSLWLALLLLDWISSDWISVRCCCCTHCRFHHALRSQFGSVVDDQPTPKSQIRLIPKAAPLGSPPTQKRNQSISLTLHKAAQHLTPRLQQRMSHHDSQKPLQPLPAMLNHVIAEAVRKHFAGQRRDGHARALPLQDLAEVFEVRVAAADDGVAQLEGWDAGVQVDLVGGVHGAWGGAVGLWVFDLWGG